MDRPLDPGADLAGFVGVEEQGDLALEEGEHGFPGGYNGESIGGDGGDPTAGARIGGEGRRGLKSGGVSGALVGEGAVEEGVDGAELAFPFLNLVFGRLPFIGCARQVFGRGVERMRRPEEMEACAAAFGEVFDRPSIEAHECGLSADNAAKWDRLRVGEAVGAGDGDQLGLGVDGNPGVDVRGELAYLGGVAGGADGVDFDEAQDGAGRDESWEQVESLQVHDLVSRGSGGCRTHGGDAAVADEDGGVGQAGTGDGMNDGAVESEGCGVRETGRREQGQGCRDPGEGG